MKITIATILIALAFAANGASNLLESTTEVAEFSNEMHVDRYQRIHTNHAASVIRPIQQAPRR